jgi:hypothetical protein
MQRQHCNIVDNKYIHGFTKLHPNTNNGVNIYNSLGFVTIS